MVNVLDYPSYPGFIPRQRKVEPENSGFPQRLSVLRKERGLTQQALADLVGSGTTQIKRYEAGASQPTLDVIRKISTALQVSADMLLFAQNERGPDDDLKLQFEAALRLTAEEKNVIRSVIESIVWTCPQN
jgi:transcriptional regulator with XRE-family HTH domain